MVDVTHQRLDPWWTRVSAVVGVGLLVRLWFVLGVARFDQPVGDQLYYSAQAFNNASGRWFEQPFAAGMPSADHPPLTAFILTPVTWLVRSTDSFITVQRLFMVMIGVASMVVMALIGRLLGGDRVGLVAVAITALYANVWVNDGLIMAESPTFLLVAVTTLVLLRHRLDVELREATEGDSRIPVRIAVLLGLLTGLLALTRAELALCAPLIVVCLAYVHRGGTTPRLTFIGTFAVCALAVVSPWLIWNQARFDESVLLSTNDGLTLAGANCDRAYYDDIGSWDIWCAYEADVPEGADASVESRVMRSQGFAYWGDHLSRYPVVAAARVLRVTSLGFIGSNTDAGEAEGRPTWVSLVGVLQFWLVVVAAVVGWRRVHSRLDRAVLTALVPVVIVVAMAANAYVRFRLPAEVGLIALAAMAFSARRPACETA